MSDGAQGVRMEDIAEGNRGESSLTDDQVIFVRYLSNVAWPVISRQAVCLGLQVSELVRVAKEIETLFDASGGGPQDIEWGIYAGALYLLQSRPITNLPQQPLKDVDWSPPFPSKQMIRRRKCTSNPTGACGVFIGPF